MPAIYFESGAAFRRWLAANHDTCDEVMIGFYKKATGRRSITYAEALDEALCYGWIDGVVRRVDAERHEQRFTPRRARSIWSNINVRHVARLKKAGRMRAPGLKAFAARDPKRTGIYSFENRPKTFDAASEKAFRADVKAWTFFDAQPPGYKRLATWFVMSAKKEETRLRRVARLVADSRAGRRLQPMTSSKKTRKAITS